jgi:cytochrome c peroxidase
MVATTLGADATGAEEASAMLSPQALQEIAQVEAEIDRIEAQTIERLAVPPDNQVQQIELLGKLMLYDKQLSVNRNEACAFCHMPETGFTGPVSELNRTTGAYPGSVRTRFSDRKPQSHAYAPLSPVLHYNRGQGDLVGGNFWDMRATGRRLGNPAAEQAEGPPTNPVEMGLPDIACAVYRASPRPYRALFESVWGRQAFSPGEGAPIQRHSNRGSARFRHLIEDAKRPGGGRLRFVETTPSLTQFADIERGEARQRLLIDRECSGVPQ